MIMWINHSFWSLMDLRHLQPDSQRNEMLTVGSEGVFPALLVIFFMSCFSFHSTPRPHFLSSFAHTHTRRQTFFILPPWYCIVLLLMWKHEAKRPKVLFHSTAQRWGKMINLWQITKRYPANWRRCKAEPSGKSLLPPSESLSHFKISLCFLSKIGNP